MSEADLVWGGLLTVGTGYETWALWRNRDATLSRTVRRWARTHTTPGKAIFTIGYVAVGAWFLGHILDWWP